MKPQRFNTDYTVLYRRDNSAAAGQAVLSLHLLSTRNWTVAAIFRSVLWLSKQGTETAYFSGGSCSFIWAHCITYEEVAY